jgi:hypothetical protein
VNLNAQAKNLGNDVGSKLSGNPASKLGGQVTFLS